MREKAARPTGPRSPSYTCALLYMCASVHAGRQQAASREGRRRRWKAAEEAGRRERAVGGKTEAAAATSTVFRRLLDGRPTRSSSRQGGREGRPPAANEADTKPSRRAKRSRWSWSACTSGFKREPVSSRGCMPCRCAPSSDLGSAPKLLRGRAAQHAPTLPPSSSRLHQAGRSGARHRFIGPRRSSAARHDLAPFPTGLSGRRRACSTQPPPRRYGQS
jgi:hypothetical protein